MTTKTHKQGGFSIVELLVVIALVAIIFVSFGTFFVDYVILYSKYQTDANNFTDLASQSERIANVLRGVTDLTSVGDNSLTAYAYFSPVDAYVSQVSYYLSNDGKTLYADVTPMTANPPNGTLLTAQKKTYAIITSFYQPTGGKLFVYYDASGTALSTPVADEHVINEIQVNLAVTGSQTKNGQNLTTTVSLRNRKTNL